MLQIISFTIFFLSFFCLPLHSQLPQIPSPSDQGPIHEAFVEKVQGELIFQAISTAPPSAMQETIPPQSDSAAIWIPGYWDWLPGRNSFVWVTGIWRVPPPGLKWIPGSWVSEPEGWVRIRGFWSPVTEGSLTYIQEAPPAPKEEHASDPPSKNSFWRPGYWFFSKEKSQYTWISGNWEAIDANWVLVPAHYSWRPEGYVFIPLYWDWPLSKRGRIYAPVFVNPDDQTSFQPVDILDNSELILWLVMNYPDYIYAIYHDYYYYPGEWEGLSPPWWSWVTWWTFPWQDQWGLWWWYTHSGYPAPFWMNNEISKKISAPSRRLLSSIYMIKPPGIITPNGLVSAEGMLKAKGGQAKPLLPANPEELKKIQELAVPKKGSTAIRPSGENPIIKQRPMRQQLTKPVIEQPEKRREQVPEVKTGAREVIIPKGSLVEPQEQKLTPGEQSILQRRQMLIEQGQMPPPKIIQQPVPVPVQVPVPVPYPVMVPGQYQSVYFLRRYPFFFRPRFRSSDLILRRRGPPVARPYGRIVIPYRPGWR